MDRFFIAAANSIITSERVEAAMLAVNRGASAPSLAPLPRPTLCPGPKLCPILVRARVVAVVDRAKTAC